MWSGHHSGRFDVVPPSSWRPSQASSRKTGSRRSRLPDDAAIASVVLVAAMWDGLPSSPAAAAVAFDIVILGALLVAHWRSSEMIGADRRVSGRR
jgi:hypothetical protein